MRHTLRETWSGLRRNLAMNAAVVVTIFVSLTLFGMGLLINRQVDVTKDRWYDKIEVSVFLCVKDSSSGNCDPGQDATQPQKDAIQAALTKNPEVQQVHYESKQQAYDAFRETFKDSPLLDTLTVDQMQDSFRVKLVNPEQYKGVVAEAGVMPGVQAVVDQHLILDKIFSALNLLKWGTVALAGLLLLAAWVQIANTIRMAAFARRRELGIMRLVGASNWYIMMPFLLESLLTGVIGWALASGTLLGLHEFAIVRNAQVSLSSLRWIDRADVYGAIGWVAVAAIGLSIIPTLIATKRYLRV
ncbi:permease-like cell division protein FtsX [Aestuariimicrobium sp. T2.26MG-19.2B]|uniref:permease-like cell division protein FtsX n=1 Tax=Aestuariimicrobium sp. T2.26MG-19.2B TaxID=3040679 RepID=UPI002477A829|nr:permease-like cell division protein FtsX [Aestuariimicrobium sp. T2.26MG-19.2B]CAI9410929.1 Cell division protein FtsX [Aestuariimicrobium sp. T2.26MG-19.2B]